MSICFGSITMMIQFKKESDAKKMLIAGYIEMKPTNKTFVSKLDRRYVILYIPECDVPYANLPRTNN